MGRGEGPRPPPSLAIRNPTPTACRSTLSQGVRRAALPALLLLLTLCGPAWAEGYEETEARLKAAGIKHKLRLEIHEAIRKGVAVLRKVQFKNGSILGQGSQTVLGGLALRHAAIPEAQKGARAATKYLMRFHRKLLRNRTYEAGLGCMLLQAMEVEKAEKKFLFQIHDRLRRAPKSDHGYWSYRSAGGDPTPNLSTAQFAALGLWSAERAGAKTATKAWRTHLEALLRLRPRAGPGATTRTATSCTSSPSPRLATRRAPSWGPRTSRWRGRR